MYDVAGGGSYIDAALYAAGISDEQLMQNLCSRLHEKINETERVRWPPRIDQLEQEEDIFHALVHLLIWMNPPPLPLPPPLHHPPKKETFTNQSKNTLLSINRHTVC